MSAGFYGLRAQAKPEERRVSKMIVLAPPEAPESRQNTGPIPIREAIVLHTLGVQVGLRA